VRNASVDASQMRVVVYLKGKRTPFRFAFVHKMLSPEQTMKKISKVYFFNSSDDSVWNL